MTAAKKQELLILCDALAADAVNDVSVCDGMPFDARTMGKIIGEHLAYIHTIITTLKEVIECLPTSST